ncbi:MAG: hypothetical protein Sapg2KO_13370 [Saprospiraceae bacterium]
MLLLTFSLSCQKTDKKPVDPSDKFQNLTETCKDSEGNVYPLVQIGDQVWMAKNLKLTVPKCKDDRTMQFTNGLERGPGVAFYDGGTRYAYYNNNPDLDYGVIYSYQAIQKCELCPSGFRLPIKTDFEKLISTLGGKTAAGKALLKSGDSGFNAEIGGRIDDYGSVLGGRIGFWWTTSIEDHPENQLNIYNFEVTSDGILKIIPQYYRVGNYVRCIKE